MAVIWYAIGIYMIGIAIVLYFRPRTMFRDNGMWKEFGLNTAQEKESIFPFWMFALVWAILSYALANLISMFFASVALNSSNVSPDAIQPISAHPNANLPLPMAMPMTMTMPTPAPIPATQTMPTMLPNRAPGYYILDPYANPAHPRYIYYGPEPPGFTPAAN